MWGLLALELKFISLKLEPVLILLRKSGISSMMTLNGITLVFLFIDPTCSLLETEEMPGATTIQKELQQLTECWGASSTASLARGDSPPLLKCGLTLSTVCSFGCHSVRFCDLQCSFNG